MGYDVHKLIGVGSFGRVFKGVDRETEKKVAIKLIPKRANTERELAALSQEFQIHKNLDHPNIVKVVDAFETTSDFVLVTEYVPGELRQLLDQYKVRESKKQGKIRCLNNTMKLDYTFSLLGQGKWWTSA